MDERARFTWKRDDSYGLSDNREDPGGARQKP